MVNLEMTKKNVISRVLRPTVDKPTLGFWARHVGPKWASIPAVKITFLVSGLMHELIFHSCRVWPMWEPTWFCILHGSCLSTIWSLKKKYSIDGRHASTISVEIALGPTITASGKFFLTNFTFTLLLQSERFIPSILFSQIENNYGCWTGGWS